jgi:hypothetical protein
MNMARVFRGGGGLLQLLVNPRLLFFEIIDPRTDFGYAFVVADVCYISFPVFYSSDRIAHSLI